MTGIKKLFAVGLSHKTASIDIRGKFSLSNSQIHALFLDAKEREIDDLLIINTCNRTEIYAWVTANSILIDLLCKYSSGNRHEFKRFGYSFENEKNMPCLLFAMLDKKHDDGEVERL